MFLFWHITSNTRQEVHETECSQEQQLIDKDKVFKLRPIAILTGQEG